MSPDRFTSIIWGDNIEVTDMGSGQIRVDVAEDPNTVKIASVHFTAAELLASTHPAKEIVPASSGAIVMPLDLLILPAVDFTISGGTFMHGQVQWNASPGTFDSVDIAGLGATRYVPSFLLWGSPTSPTTNYPDLVTVSVLGSRLEVEIDHDHTTITGGGVQVIAHYYLIHVLPEIAV
jgi:hypothetical protein